MTNWQFDGLLTQNGWLENAVVVLDKDGTIASIGKQAKGRPQRVKGYAIPGLPNGHSHAFQYAMVGLAEIQPRAHSQDDFWSWREAMYSLALKITPDQLEAVAAMLYAEMLRHGITSVVEFHYLHHDQNGKEYKNVSENSERLVAAAESAGIELCLVPVFYKQGNFAQEAFKGQRRFLSKSVAAYDSLVEKVMQAGKRSKDFSTGRGIHSLRAANAADAIHILSDTKAHYPLHLHISEQQKEVNDCVATYGKRPIEWLSDNIEINKRHCMVHATHLDKNEINLLAKAGATAIVCPTTEGNLGDGFFPLTDYLAKGGRWTIGSDSQITLNPFEDLRWFDYRERLIKLKRNPLGAALNSAEESGHLSFKAAWIGGQASLGKDAAEFFAPGSSFDCAVIDRNSPIFVAKPKEKIMSTLIYGGDASSLLGTMRRGKWLVKDGHHIRYEKIYKNFCKAMTSLI